MGRKKITFYIFWATILSALFLPGFSELQRLKWENDSAQKRILLLEQNNRLLKDEIDKMEKDPVYFEKKAREKLGIIKKGEVLYTPSKNGS